MRVNLGRSLQSLLSQDCAMDELQFKRPCDTVGGRNPAPRWDAKNLVNNGINYQPQRGERRISEPSTICLQEVKLQNINLPPKVGPSLPQVHESLFLFQLQVSLPTIAATLIGVIPDMWAAKIRCLDRNFSPQQANKKMTTFRAKKKILPPQKKTPFPGILYNHGRLFYHHTFFKACCLWDSFRMTVWSVMILKQTSSYVLFHSSSVKHLAGWNFSISEWSLVHLLCSSSTGVDFIL